MRSEEEGVTTLSQPVRGLGVYGIKRVLTPLVPLVLILVLIDLASKLLAYWLLPLGKQIPTMLGDVALILTLNKEGIGTQARGIINGNDALTIALGCAWWVEAIIIVLIAKSKYRKAAKIRLGLLAAVALSIGCAGVSKTVHWHSGQPYLLCVLLRTGNVALVIVLFRLFESAYFRACFGFFLAAAAGNALSLFYPPFRIIDFIYSDWIHSVLRLGIFNLADLYYYPVYVMLALSPIVLLVRRAQGQMPK
jgi:lipoprotein signal peptidase